jgi:hypothetical protein
MNVLIVNASPKRITSASSYFAGLLRCALGGINTQQVKLGGPNVYAKLFDRFKSIDALVMVLPVYVDSVPSHVLRFLKEAERFCKENDCKFKLYTITNCGFYEGGQCKNVLAIMQAFANAAGLTWGGGLGIGAGEMLSVLRLTAISSVLGAVVVGSMLAAGMAMGVAEYISLGVSAALFLLFSAGLFWSTGKLGRIIKKRETTANFYTGVTFCPRFVFAIFASAYMIARAAAVGTPIWRLYDSAK